jgi:hypothetical protein
VAFVFYFGLGLTVLIAGFRAFRKGASMLVPPRSQIQFGIWAGLLISGLIVLAFQQIAIGALLLLVAQFFPRQPKERA